MHLFRLFAVCLIAALPAAAQPPSRNPRSVTLAHIDLNSADPAAATAFWTDVIGTSVVARGPLNGVGMIGAWIVFTRNPPSGPSVGSAIDHLELKVPDLQPFIDRLAKTSFKSFQPKPGDDVLMIDGPDGVRIELIADSSMFSPLEFDRIVFRTPQPNDAQAWYIKHFGARTNPDDDAHSIRLAGTGLTFAQAESVAPTMGRAIDHISLEVKDLTGFCNLDTQASSVFLTDPWGTRIELTEAH
jgi:catechol 2,3-dioxygenase-like lactoylglutathione lyase family enzyme